METVNGNKENQELTEVNALLDRFVYSCSHDLKGPLTSIKGLIHLAEKSSLDNATGECLKLIHESAIRMDHFLKAMEDYMLNARSEIIPDKINFSHIIEQILITHKETIDKYNIKVNHRINDNEVFYSDRVRVKIILQHILENAFCYQDRRKTEKFIDIEIKVENGIALIEICDNGEGIPKDSINDIYKMFYRSSESSRGSGLGLFLVKEALNKINGKVNAISSKGVGTNFILTLPDMVKNN